MADRHMGPGTYATMPSSVCACRSNSMLEVGGSANRQASVAASASAVWISASAVWISLCASAVWISVMKEDVWLFD